MGNELFKPTISFENSSYRDIIIYLIYNGKEKLKDDMPHIKLETTRGLVTIYLDDTMKTIKPKNFDNNDNSLIACAYDYIKSQKELLLKYWNAEIEEQEAKQIFFEEKNEYFGVVNLSKKITGLPVNIIATSDYLTARDKIVRFQNDYEDKVNYTNTLPISISKDNPKILINRKLNIKIEDFKLVCNFIKNNYDILLKHIKNKLTDSDLIDEIKFCGGAKHE